MVSALLLTAAVERRTNLGLPVDPDVGRSIPRLGCTRSGLASDRSATLQIQGTVRVVECRGTGRCGYARDCGCRRSKHYLRPVARQQVGKDIRLDRGVEQHDGMPRLQGGQVADHRDGFVATQAEDE
jgi:hypothetical protein